MWKPNMKKMNVMVEEEEPEETWELARAFAEDKRSTMGTNWPPRSYTCSFCRREFRSAQALGGHMNVHRRDRARINHQAQVQAQARYTGPAPVFYQLADCRNTGHGGVSLPTINNSRYINYDEIQVNEISEGVIKVNHEEQETNEELDLELRLGHNIPTPASQDKLFENNSNNNNNMSVLNFR